MVAPVATVVEPFPFLLGGTFIEAAPDLPPRTRERLNFPSFWEGLSLRLM